MKRWKKCNPNPKRNLVGDCTVRALSLAIEQDWETTYAGLSAVGFVMCDMPSANNVWGNYLKQHGFKRYVVDESEKEPYTVEKFCKEHPVGVYVLAVEGHVVCVRDGFYYDTWDSGEENPIYYWMR